MSFVIIGIIGKILLFQSVVKPYTKENRVLQNLIRQNRIKTTKYSYILQKEGGK